MGGRGHVASNRQGLESLRGAAASSYMQLCYPARLCGFVSVRAWCFAERKGKDDAWDDSDEDDAAWDMMLRKPAEPQGVCESWTTIGRTFCIGCTLLLALALLGRFGACLVRLRHATDLRNLQPKSWCVGLIKKCERLTCLALAHHAGGGWFLLTGRKPHERTVWDPHAPADALPASDALPAAAQPSPWFVPSSTTGHPKAATLADQGGTNTNDFVLENLRATLASASTTSTAAPDATSGQPDPVSPDSYEVIFNTTVKDGAVVVEVQH